MRPPCLRGAASPSQGTADDKQSLTQTTGERTVLRDAVKKESRIVRTDEGGLKRAQSNPRRLPGGSGSGAETQGRKSGNVQGTEGVLKGKGAWGAFNDLNEGQRAWQAGEEGRGDPEKTRMSLDRQVLQRSHRFWDNGPFCLDQWEAPGGTKSRYSQENRLSGREGARGSVPCRIALGQALTFLSSFSQLSKGAVAPSALQGAGEMTWCTGGAPGFLTHCFQGAHLCPSAERLPRADRS